MTSAIPTFDFNTKRHADLPFEILTFADLPDFAKSPQPRRHTFYVIFWVTGGQGVHNIDFEAWPIVANTLYFVTPGQVHFWEIERAASGYAVLFTADFIATHPLEQITLQGFDFFHQSVRKPMMPITDPAAASIFSAICEHMLDEFRGKAYGRFTLLQCQLTTLLIHAQRHYQAERATMALSAGSELAQRYLQLIESHFNDLQTVAAYAQHLGITAGHLRDSTRIHLGRTPTQLLNQRITLEAKRQLAHSSQTIAAIAHSLRFSDPSYFSRFFKRETGQSPSEFREKYQNRHA